MPQLPALGFNPKNALLDVSPITNALTGIQNQANKDREFGMEQERLDMAKQSHAQSSANQARVWKQNEVETLGRQAMAIDSLPDGPQRQAAWQRIVHSHGANGLTPEELDHRSGPKIMAAQAGMFRDPMEAEGKRLDMDYKRALIGQANRKAEPDPIDQMLMERLSRGRGGAIGGQQHAPQQSAPQQAPPMLQPQSFNGNATPLNPGIQLVDDRTQAAPMPQPSAPQQDMVQTPYGPMGRDEALALGGAMLLNPKRAAAGKAILDAAQTGGAQGLGKTGENQNDKEELSATGALATLDSIRSNYDAKFLNIPKRVNLWGKALQDKFGALPPKDADELKAYSQFRQATWHNLNRVLKDLSGTAVTENEMQRQLLDLPNAGQGIFDGDSPAQFDSKLKGSMTFMRSAVARARYLRSKGFTGKPWEAGIEVGDMPAVIDQRGAQIEQQLRQMKPQADPMSIEQETARRLKQEFGI